ncbi:2-hydroxycarboxylate transporter family protein [Treponema primitia]|uniref:2-hydroxycarboxylate transporter family protein n=1 Tax=Treponema primitia TaxID=88058 RepID=UPI00397EB185
MATQTNSNGLVEKEKRSFELFGMPWYFFIIFSAVVLIATYLGKLPKGMIGAFPLMIVVGTLFWLIGDNAPIIKTFLGGGAIVVIFGSAALNTFKILPEAAVKIIDNFEVAEGFLDFYIAALITGSIMGMNRKLLIRAAVRYLPAVLGGVVVALGLAALAAVLIGYKEGPRGAVLFVALPIMGGGMGAGAVPLSKIFGEGMGREAGEMLSMMIPAVALGNALAIVAGGLLNRIGKVKTSLTGGTGVNAQLLLVQGTIADELKIDPVYQKARDSLSLVQMGAGLFIATTFFALGAVINKFVPTIHSYAWMILSVAFVKALGILPQKFEICCYQWYQFVMTNLTAVLLVGIGISYTNLNQIALAFTPQYLILVFVTVLGAILGSGIVGRLVGFYPIDSAITAGLCMANMGGTGDVAVLSASKRMELMPFAQISSRIGGAFILILSSVILQILFH